MIWMTAAIAAIALAYVGTTLKSYRRLVVVLAEETERMEKALRVLESELESEKKQKDEDLATLNTCKETFKTNGALISTHNDTIKNAKRAQENLLIKRQGIKLEQASEGK